MLGLMYSGPQLENHYNYLQDHHDLHKLPFDPKDPNNREKLLAIIAAVLAQGKESLYKNTTDIFLRSLYQIALEKD